jgi:diketogulonate reductase-like aldo/keto reductase
MPWLGLGVFRADNGNEVEQAIHWALEVGYRHIDTASIYENEEGVGRAIASCGVPRESLFVTTKVWNSDQGEKTTPRALEESLRKLGLEYVDLYLIHWPVKGKFKETWRAMEQLYQQGKARAIGVSNFLEHHLRDLMNECDVVPMVNQCEFHPRLVQPELLKYCRENKIQFEAWSPIMKGRVNDVAELKELAEAYGKTPAQIALRWDLQHRVVTIPKSVRRERIVENAGIFDFELSVQDMAKIDALNTCERIGPDPDHIDF